MFSDLLHNVCFGFSRSCKNAVKSILQNVLILVLLEAHTVHFKRWIKANSDSLIILMGKGLVNTYLFRQDGVVQDQGLDTVICMSLM